MEQVYNDLLKKEGLTADTVDSDTQLQLMAKAANQVRGKTTTLDHTPELPGLVIGEHSTVKDVALEMGKNYK